MEALHTQYLSAMSVNDSIRLSNISCQLRELMIKANLLDQQAGEDTFTIVVNQLPRRIESLRNRFTERGMHVLGNKPNNETVDLYIRNRGWVRINEESIIHVWIRHQMNLTTLFGRYQHFFHRVQAPSAEVKQK